MVVENGKSAAERLSRRQLARDVERPIRFASARRPVENDLAFSPKHVLNTSREGVERLSGGGGFRAYGGRRERLLTGCALLEREEVLGALAQFVNCGARSFDLRQFPLVHQQPL